MKFTGKRDSGNGRQTRPTSHETANATLFLDLAVDLANFDTGSIHRGDGDNTAAA